MSVSFPALLRQMKALGATDLFLCKGKAPAYRINGKITHSAGEALSEENLELFAIGVIPEPLYQRFVEDLEINVSYHATGIGRFRISIFQQRQVISMVIRAIPSEIPDINQLGIPDQMQNLIMQKRGLILISGPSSSGKSTTFAALVNERNHKDASHIITIEDPIEYLLEHQQSIVNQREIGIDAISYERALNGALRQSPDLLGIGEIRGAQELEYALGSADSGHLCIATLHANNAVHAIERVSHFFPENKREQILLSLAMHLRCILAQQLIPGNAGQQIAAFEMMPVSSHVRDLISRGDFIGIRQALEKDSTAGMLSMDQSLYNLFSQNRISKETALEYATSYRDMRLRMRLSDASVAVLEQ